jgi:23S rRNA pseudouridine1911/1915/1917 synthase
MQVDIRLEDADILVVDKPPGLSTGAPKTIDKPDLLAAMRNAFGWAQPLVRLDRPVSGLVVIARHRKALEALLHQLVARTVQRRFVAAVGTLLDRDSGVFDRPKDHTVLSWWVRSRIEAANVTIIDAELQGSLRERIRGCFHGADLPLLADDHARRTFLHASVLAFTHPTRREPLRFESKLPDDLARWKDALVRTGRV